MATKPSCLSLSRIVQLLETYRGRDKLIRLLNYTFCLLSGASKRYGRSGIAEKLGIIASEMCNLRVLLRLFDDSAMFLCSSSYGFGGIEKDCYLRGFQLVNNFVDQCYYPLEHVAWARDVKLLSGSSEHLWSFGSVIWLTSLSMGVLSAIRKLILLRREENDFLEKRKGEGDIEYRLCSCGKGEYVGNNHLPTCSLRRQLNQFSKQKKYLLLTIFEHTCDGINAVHWLPQGYAWANKLPEEIVGMFGTLATICQLYKAVFPLKIKDDCP